MLYLLHDAAAAAIVPVRAWAQAASAVMRATPGPDMLTVGARSMVAWADVANDVLRPRGKPEWNVKVTRGAEEPLHETVELDQPFVRLMRFQAPGATGPRVLLVAPMSGHHATLLRGTVQDMTDAGFEVFVTDWRDARIVPMLHGDFDLSSYVETVIGFLQHLGPDTHVVAVCQPAPAVIAAVSLMASRNDPAQPRSMTLMGGPVDTRCAPTVVTKLAQDKPISWFESHVVATVPPWHPGAFRRVYPGFLQHAGFIAMNPDRHLNSHYDYFLDLVRGDEDKSDFHRDFYDEYNAVLDMPAEYYLDTIKTVFQDFALVNGTWVVDGKPVRPQDIKTTALLTIEGELDDISGAGQTQAAHGLCSGVPAALHFHYDAMGAGHYGIFSGKRWREKVYPTVRDFIASHQGPAAPAAPLAIGSQKSASTHRALIRSA